VTLTVLVPVFNGSRYLGETLGSLEVQEGPVPEVIVPALELEGCSPRFPEPESVAVVARDLGRIRTTESVRCGRADGDVGHRSAPLPEAGALRTPVITVSVAILRQSWRRGMRARVRAWVLGRSHLVLVYATAQVHETARFLGLPLHRVRFVPLGVDADFFILPSPHRSDGGTDVLAVGTNEGKDYPTLMAALGRGRHCLVATDGVNAGIVRRSTTSGVVRLEHDMSIAELRERYARAGRCVISFRETSFSSGKTVLLELMATGVKPIVSDVSGIRDYVRDGETTEVVPPGDPRALAAVLSQPSPQDPMIRDHVRESFSSRRFSRDLAAVCREVMVGSSVSESQGGDRPPDSIARLERGGSA
jgi:glycosyltransferase involved in cell wall biosynthesis